MRSPDPAWFERRLRATRWLVLAGIFIGYFSYGLYKLADGPYDLYPFFHWRLYSAPVGAEGHTTYRIYTQDAPGAPWVRRPIRADERYDPFRYSLVLSRMTTSALADSLGETDMRGRLEAFAREMVPGAWRYSIVAETFAPLALLDDSTAYDTSLVFRFDGPRARP